MKSIYTVLAAVLLTASVFAQSPEKMSYQAVIRNSSDQLVTSQDIGMQISILQSSASGTAVYVETQSSTTNANGLVTIAIGNGTVVSGDFNAIDWSNDVYYIKTETDPTAAAGTDYTITGTSQLMSVPYALHAKTADSITGIIIETQDLADVAAINNSVNTQLKNVTDPTDEQDAATKIYTDSLIHSLIARIDYLENIQFHAVLWNKLGSDEEVQNSEIGPGGTVVGTVNYNNDVKFGKGLTPNTGSAGSGVDFPTTVVDPEKGCFEMWTKFYAAPVAYNYGVYGFVNVAHWSHNVIAAYWHNSSSRLAFDLTFNGTTYGAGLESFDPPLDTPVHLAFVWDRNGIDGSGDYIRIYVDGVMIASNSADNSWGTDNSSGNFRVAAPWDSNFGTDRYSVDNIKIWNYAKISFEDRNRE